MDEKIDKICLEIDKISKREYIKNGYISKKIEVKPKKDTIKEKDMEIEINKIKGQFNKIIQKKERKSNSKPIIPNNDNLFMDNKSDVFNIIDNDTDYIEWR